MYLSYCLGYLIVKAEEREFTIKRIRYEHQNRALTPPVEFQIDSARADQYMMLKQYFTINRYVEKTHFSVLLFEKITIKCPYSIQLFRQLPVCKEYQMFILL